MDKADEKCTFENFFGKKPEVAKHLRVFGEMGVLRRIENDTQHNMGVMYTECGAPTLGLFECQGISNG